MGSKRYEPLAAVLFFLTLMCWAIASPIGSGPDADYHLSSIWCGWGENENLCKNRGFNGNQYVAEVPFMFQMCNSRPIEYFPECPEITSRPETQILRTAFSAQQNLYYKVLRIFASEEPNQSVLVMRFINSFLASFIFWGLLKFTSGKIRFGVLTSWTIGLVPVAIQYFSNINPRGWATLAVMSSWAFLAQSLERKKGSRQQIILGAFFALTAFLAISTRIDATVFVVFTSSVVILWRMYTCSLLKPRQIAFGLLGVSFTALLVRQIPYVGDRLALSYPVSFPLKQFLLMQFTFGPESIVSSWGYRIGQQGNGPGFTGLVGTGLAAAAIALALRNSKFIQKSLVFLVLLFLYLVTIRGSAIIQTLVPASGEYVLGLSVFLIAMIIYTSQSDVQLFDSQSGKRIIISLLTISHLIAFYSYFEYYTKRGTGTGVYQNLSLDQQWWWTTSVNPNLVFYIGAISFPFALNSAWNVHGTKKSDTPLFLKYQSRILHFLSQLGQKINLTDKATN